MAKSVIVVAPNEGVHFLRYFDCLFDQLFCATFIEVTEVGRNHELSLDFEQRPARNHGEMPSVRVR